MAGVPITFVGIMYPRDKSVKPYPFTAVGMAGITGLTIGGGPIVPPDEIDELPDPQPPLEIWPNPPEGTAPHPEHPIVLPDPILPPDQPPNPIPAPHPGWNWSAVKSGWYFLYVPGSGQAGPKRR